jgi:hypothetical protein
MRILVIISSYEMYSEFIEHIYVLNHYMKQLVGATVDYAGISSKDDFANYESILQFKYKVISSKKQLSKMCDFISETPLDYDWYVKFRPEIMLIEQIPFEKFSQTAINARARLYIGPKIINNGLSVGGPGVWNKISHSFYDAEEKCVVLDDQLYIFHQNIINSGGFRVKPYNNEKEDEYLHSKYWISKGIPLNVVGIDLIFKYANCGDLQRSGPVNLSRALYLAKLQNEEALRSS